MDHSIVEKFKNYFAQLDSNKDFDLTEIYATDIVFKDPIHEISGLENLISYFKKLNDNLLEGSFHFTSESTVEDTAYLSWEMNLKLKKPNKTVKASGISVLTIEDKITKQRDYYDAGELFYEHIPVLGGVIRLLKKKLAN